MSQELVQSREAWRMLHSELSRPMGPDSGIEYTWHYLQRTCFWPLQQEHLSNEESECMPPSTSEARVFSRATVRSTLVGGIESTWCVEKIGHTYILYGIGCVTPMDLERFMGAMPHGWRYNTETFAIESCKGLSLTIDGYVRMSGEPRMHLTTYMLVRDMCQLFDRAGVTNGLLFCRVRELPGMGLLPLDSYAGLTEFYRMDRYLRRCNHFFGPRNVPVASFSTFILNGQMLTYMRASVGLQSLRQFARQLRDADHSDSFELGLLNVDNRLMVKLCSSSVAPLCLYEEFLDWVQQQPSGHYRVGFAYPRNRVDATTEFATLPTLLGIDATHPMYNSVYVYATEVLPEVLPQSPLEAPSTMTKFQEQVNAGYDARGGRL